MGIKFVQKLADKVRQKSWRIVKNGTNNVIELCCGAKIKKIIVNGCNNSILSSSKNIRANIEIWGNSNSVEIEEGVQLNRDHIYIGAPGSPSNNCKVRIGQNTCTNGITIRLCEDESEVTIGENCLFSSGVNIWCSDSHSILDNQNELLNLGKFIKIGNHVWCGMDVKIGKNIEIQNDTIIGWGSVVTKSFYQSNILLAGNPARMAKEGVNWDMNRPSSLMSKSKANAVEI